MNTRGDKSVGVLPGILRTSRSADAGTCGPHERMSNAGLDSVASFHRRSRCLRHYPQQPLLLKEYQLGEPASANGMKGRYAHAVAKYVCPAPHSQLDGSSGSSCNGAPARLPKRIETRFLLLLERGVEVAERRTHGVQRLQHSAQA